MSKGIKEYPVDKFELVLFSNTIVSKICTVVLDVLKVHELRCLKLLKHLNITGNS